MLSPEEILAEMKARGELPWLEQPAITGVESQVGKPQEESSFCQSASVSRSTLTPTNIDQDGPAPEAPTSPRRDRVRTARQSPSRSSAKSSAADALEDRSAEKEISRLERDLGELSYVKDRLNELRTRHQPNWPDCDDWTAANILRAGRDKDPNASVAAIVSFARDYIIELRVEGWGAIVIAIRSGWKLNRRRR